MSVLFPSQLGSTTGTIGAIVGPAEGLELGLVLELGEALELELELLLGGV